MNLSIIDATEKPMTLISVAAGTSYGKFDAPAKRVRNCYERGHMSVFEHASFTARIDGISRACSHQLVRHRMASFVQQSQRYTSADGQGDWYVKPPKFTGDMSPFIGMAYDKFFEDAMTSAMANYRCAVVAGVPLEDARYLLPEATKTAITMTMNARELFHFLNLRQDRRAQWEIRELANAIEKALENHNDEWRELIALRWRDCS